MHAVQMRDCAWFLSRQASTADPGLLLPFLLLLLPPLLHHLPVLPHLLCIIMMPCTGGSFTAFFLHQHLHRLAMLACKCEGLAQELGHC